MLLDEVEKRDEQWKKEWSYETIKDYYTLKSEIAESWMNYTESIRIIKEFLVPLTKENEKDNLHAEYLLAKANWFGNRKVRAYYMLNDIVGNSSHSVEDRILSYLHLAWIFITISSNKAVDDHILKARKLQKYPLPFFAKYFLFKNNCYYSLSILVHENHF